MFAWLKDLFAKWWYGTPAEPKVVPPHPTVPLPEPAAYRPGPFDRAGVKPPVSPAPAATCGSTCRSGCDRSARPATTATADGPDLATTLLVASVLSTHDAPSVPAETFTAPAPVVETVTMDVPAPAPAVSTVTFSPPPPPPVSYAESTPTYSSPPAADYGGGGDFGASAGCGGGGDF